LNGGQEARVERRNKGLGFWAQICPYLATRGLRNSVDLSACVKHRNSKVSPKIGSPKLPGGKGALLLVDVLAFDSLNKT